MRGLTPVKRLVVFEVKSEGLENELFLQMFDRLTCMNTSHILKNVLMFGATKHSLYLFANNVTERAQYKLLTPLSSTHADILKLWWLASQYSLDSFDCAEHGV